MNGGEETPAAGLPPQAVGLATWLRRLIRFVILAVIFLTPLLYLPATADTLFIKAAFVEAAAVIVAAAWLLESLLTKRLAYKRTPWNAAFLVVALALVAATFLSASPWPSFWGSDPTGEKALSILAFAALSFVAAAAFSRREVRIAAGLLLASFFLLGAFTLGSILAGRFGLALPAWLSVNPIGTVNALAAVVAIGFAFSSLLALTARSGRGPLAIGRRTYWLGLGASAVLLTDLVLIGFRMAWLAIGAVMLLLAAFHFTRRESGGEGAPQHLLRPRSLAVALAVLVLAVFALFRPLPFVSRIFVPPLELSPSPAATLRIAAKSLAARPAFGLGPGNFRAAYNRFRDAALNLTPFWAVRFNHGFSFLSTLPVTLGAVGFLAFLGLVVVAVGGVARSLWLGPAADPVPAAFAGGAIGVMVLWFTYAANFTVNFLFFAFLGLFAAAAAELKPAAGPASWWRLTRRTILVESPALNFILSLVAVLGVVLALVGLSSLASQYAAEVHFRRAQEALGRYGNTDTAKVFLGRAIGLNSVEPGYYLGRAQAALVAVERLIAQAAASPSEDLSGQFRQEFSAGVNAANRASALAGDDPQPWFALGSLYEAVLPFLPGAERAALDAYGRAAALDPPNPALALAQGRVALAEADTLALAISQTASGEERSRLEASRAEAMVKAREFLTRARELKADFADAHFLLAQLAIRENKLPEAVSRTEDAARLAPADIGVHFQLGVLYYRSGDLSRAKAALERALLLNENYSNARYFLGLVYDRKGDRDGALSQFQKIAALNPGNDEVRRIIANLEAGKPALAGIVPPGQAPEARREPPVREPGRPPGGR